MRQLLNVLAATVLLSGPGLSSPPSSGPGNRNAHAMIFDERRQAILLFGGADASAVLADLWEWNGASWRALDLQGPAPRTFPAFAWDAARGEGVLFGGRAVLFGRDGQRNTFLSDTWLLRENGWHRAGNDGPPPRSEAGVAYDRHRRVVVLFGGYHDTGGRTTRLGDTWEWDGATWRMRSDTGPVPRSGVAMAYDERSRRVVLFGGNGGPRSDTWTWDGVRWSQLGTPATPGRFNSISAYDSVRQHVLRTTGWNGSERVRETWRFVEARWRLAAVGGPGARNHSAMAFDRRRGRMVLHGGHDGELVFGDTWEWDGRTWNERLSAPPQRRLENGH
jgi:hypothetical protein